LKNEWTAKLERVDEGSSDESDEEFTKKKDDFSIVTIANNS
jgi:hypothetical protein